MNRHLNQIAALRIALGLVVAVGILGSRTEKLFVEVLGHLPSATHVTEIMPAHEPFDPAPCAAIRRHGQPVACWHHGQTRSLMF